MPHHQFGYRFALYFLIAITNETLEQIMSHQMDQLHLRQVWPALSMTRKVKQMIWCTSTPYHSTPRADHSHTIGRQTMGWLPSCLGRSSQNTQIQVLCNEVELQSKQDPVTILHMKMEIEQQVSHSQTMQSQWHTKYLARGNLQLMTKLYKWRN